jgi:hypothetical protein
VSALRKLPIEQCRDIGRETSSSVLAARQSARWSSARRASRCYAPSPVGGHGEAPRVKNGPALAGHGAEAVHDAITRTVITLPEELGRSLTWDQGAEMAQHDRLKIDAGIQVYFCDPQSPWQRGTNENTNGLLRQLLPERHRPEHPQR